MPLQTVEPQRLYRQIAEQLRALIAQGAFDAGARLPAERDLAKQLGVSRPSVREALIALEVEDWVEVRIGSGVYVLDRAQCARRPVASAEAGAPSGAVAPSEWGPLELIRARRVVEGETAAIAARCGKRKDVDAMSRAIASMHEQAERQVAPLDGDRAFHLAIAGASGNTVLVETVQGFLDSRRGPIFTRLGGYFETATSWRVAIAEHEAIRDAIAARDAEAARDAMHAHMDKSHRRFSVNWRRTKST
ncbi:FadR/GntR family transcriptional regulator [Verminephrobacter eiseniae]|uniref:FadR/GntR family transcriptional regulator n=1 Tax=Verminephrobacter eiseniae TaxID=364317 RepID=UPI0022382B04|nr:FadR/GntR family transcriptional regulator [Verminephrobacter eiseniae]MCW5236299.1 FadR family transcriptional regulator [Verminephrobacter eiseniae]